MQFVAMTCTYIKNGLNNLIHIKYNKPSHVICLTELFSHLKVAQNDVTEEKEEEKEEEKQTRSLSEVLE